MRRLKKISPQMPEYPMLRHYLELIVQLPWGIYSQVLTKYSFREVKKEE